MSLPSAKIILQSEHEFVKKYCETRSACSEVELRLILSLAHFVLFLNGNDLSSSLCHHYVMANE
jgi:hypothetical protein